MFQPQTMVLQAISQPLPGPEFCALWEESAVVEEMHTVYSEVSHGPLQTVPGGSLALPGRMWFWQWHWCPPVPPKTFSRPGLPLPGVHA